MNPAALGVSQLKTAGEFKHVKESFDFNPKEILITAKFSTALICCFSERGKPHVEVVQGNILRYTVYTPMGERIINQSILELLEHDNPEQLANEIYASYGGIFGDV